MNNWLSKVESILSADTSDLRELADIAGVDPSKLYRDVNFRDADLRGQNLVGVDLSHADLSKCSLSSEQYELLEDNASLRKMRPKIAKPVSLQEKVREPVRETYLVHAANLLIGVAAFVAAPTIGAGAVAPAYLSLRGIFGSGTTGTTELVDELADRLTAALAARHPTDADILLPQMIEAGLPTPSDLAAKGLDAKAIVALMLRRLTDPEHRRPEIIGFFEGAVTPVFKRLLNDATFVDTLGPQIAREVLARVKAIADILTDLSERYGSLALALDESRELRRTHLEALAVQFEIEAPSSLSEDELRDQLAAKADDFRRYRQDIDTIDDRTVGIGNLKAAARDAAERLDFPEVESLLSRVDEVETNIAAQTKELRAENALMRGRVEEAYRHFTAAAYSLAEVGEQQMAARFREHGKQLFRYSDRFGGRGFEYAVEAYNKALLVYSEAEYPLEWATTQNDLAVALGQQGNRIGGAEGTRLLVASIDACRAALRVFTEVDHPVAWAETQNDLATALRFQGSRVGGAEGARLLGEAIDAFRAALRVYTEADHPVQWAMTQSNLAIALGDQGSRVGGEEGARLLGEAVDACRAALRVRTEADHPVQWAMTQNNLGVALRDQGSRVGGEEGARLLGEAVDAYRAALRVTTEADHPVDWAMTQNNLGVALRDQGSRVRGKEGARLLGGAVDAYRAAMRVFTEADHPVQWAMTHENVAVVEFEHADIDTVADPRTHLEAALTNVDAALTVFDPEHTAYNHDKATHLRSDILARLAALGRSA